jgi:hypothetical protein
LFCIRFRLMVDEARVLLCRWQSPLADCGRPQESTEQIAFFRAPGGPASFVLEDITQIVPCRSSRSAQLETHTSIPP